MYELKKKIGKVFTSKFVGTGPSSYEKKNLPGRSLTKVEKHCVQLGSHSWDRHCQFSSDERHDIKSTDYSNTE